MSYILSNRSKQRLEGVHPFLKEVINMAISESPDDFGIPTYGGLRTAKVQKELYDKGRSIESLERGEKPITYTDGIRKKSNHQISKYGYGEAFDIYIYDHNTNKASWNVERLTNIAIHILKCADKVKENSEYKDLVLTWGGNWTRFKDYPHFQINRI